MDSDFAEIEELARRITRLEERLDEIGEPSKVSKYYSVAEFAEKVQRSPYSVREWCRNGRIRATRRSGRGPYREYVISHSEFVYYVEFGLRPLYGSDAMRRNG